MCENVNVLTIKLNRVRNKINLKSKPQNNIKDKLQKLKNLKYKRHIRENK